MSEERKEVMGYLNKKQIASFLGIGISKANELCRKRPHNFPVVLIGNRYQADADMLAKWKEAWYMGEFDIND